MIGGGASRKDGVRKSMIRKSAAAVLTALILAAAMLAGCAGGSGGGSVAGGNASDSVMKEAAEYLVENVAVDTIDSMGGGWVPFALKMSGTDAADEDYYLAYCDSIRAAVKNGGAILNEDRPTANERVSMNLKALGKDPTDVEGEDLMKFADDLDAVRRQGINAEIYALISADHVGYELEHEADYLDDIIASQMEDGSFGMDSSHPDSDITAMAVQALSIYDSRVPGSQKSDERAEKAIDAALEWLRGEQQEDGSYGNAESTSQVIIALGCLGQDPESAGFTKGENDLIDGLMVYHTDGAFCHMAGDGVDLMATEQSLLALDAAKLAREGKRIFK